MQDYNTFQKKEEEKQAQDASVGSWGTFIAVGLLSTAASALFAIQKMRN